MSWKASLLWSLGWLSRAVSRITMGCSFILLTPSPFCGRLKGKGGWLLSRLASQETFPAFFTKKKTTLQRAGCAAKSQAPSWSYIHPHMGKNFLASFTRTESTVIFFLIWNRGERRERREVERKEGRKSHGQHVGKPNTNTLTWKAETQFASMFPDSPEELKRGWQHPMKTASLKQQNTQWHSVHIPNGKC